MSKLTESEYKVLLAATLSRDFTVGRLLSNNLDNLLVLKRAQSSAGLYVDFKDNSVSMPAMGSIIISGIELSLKGIDAGAGAVVYIENGLFSMLEIFTYGEPLPVDWDKKITGFHIKLS